MIMIGQMLSSLLTIFVHLIETNMQIQEVFSTYFFLSIKMFDSDKRNSDMYTNSHINFPHNLLIFCTYSLTVGVKFYTRNIDYMIGKQPSLV